jgi:hypothetical protein
VTDGYYKNAWSAASCFWIASAEGSEMREVRLEVFHLTEQQRKEFMAKLGGDAKAARDAARSLMAYLHKRGADTFLRGLTVAGGVLHVEGNLNQQAAEFAQQWAQGPGAMVGITGVEIVTLGDKNGMVDISSGAVEVTQEQMRTALTTLLGASAPQVTVTAFDLVPVLPRHHFAIAWADWQAAAQAEGLEIENEGGQGFTIWKRGAAKQPVAPLKPAASCEQQQRATTPQSDPRAIARKAQAYQAEQAKLGRTVSASDAVRHVQRLK